MYELHIDNEYNIRPSLVKIALQLGFLRLWKAYCLVRHNYVNTLLYKLLDEVLCLPRSHARRCGDELPLGIYIS